MNENKTSILTKEFKREMLTKINKIWIKNKKA